MKSFHHVRPPVTTISRSCRTPRYINTMLYQCSYKYVQYYQFTATSQIGQLVDCSFHKNILLTTCQLAHQSPYLFAQHTPLSYHYHCPNLMLTPLFKSLDVPIKAGRLLVHGRNFGQMPFVLPLMTHMDVSGS